MHHPTRQAITGWTVAVLLLAGYVGSYVCGSKPRILHGYNPGAVYRDFQSKEAIHLFAPAAWVESQLRRCSVVLTVQQFDEEMFDSER